MAIVETTITPIGTATTSVSKYVAKCHEVLKDHPEIKHQLTPMGTILEGDLAKIMEVIAKMHEVPFDQGADRVSTLIKIDDRRDKEGTMDGKMESVRSKM